MADTTPIDHSHHSLNFWMGCTKVSPGCANCFAEREMKLYGWDPYAVVRAADKTFNRPLARRRRDAKVQVRGTYHWPDGNRVFVCSWSDFFHAAADQWRPDAWDIIRQRPGLTFIIPTKRPERIPDYLPDDWGTGWPHVWLLASVEDQDAADLRIPQLLQVPAVVRGVSCEPMLGPIWIPEYTLTGCPTRVQAINLEWQDNLGPWPRLHWVIAGSESGPSRRPAEVEWFRSLRDQCQAAGVPYYLKQMDVDGKLTKMPLLDGRQWSEVPHA